MPAGLFSPLISDPIVIGVQAHYRKAYPKTLAALEKYIFEDNFIFLLRSADK